MQTFLRCNNPSAGNAKLDSGDLSVKAVAISLNLSLRQSFLDLILSSQRNLSLVGGEPDVM